jgi:hypothetical protein
MGIANITNNILTDSGITVTSLPSGSGTTNEISYWVSASSIGSLTTATYPSLTELSYVKGVTSSIQTQFSGKQNSSTNLTSIDGLTFASTSFVKMTAAGTFALDTNTYLTANQSITLSGDISGTGTTAITTAIGANKVTNAMLAQVATGTFLGRVTAATGDVETLTGTQATTLLDVFSSTLKGLVPLSGGGTTNFLRADGTWAAPAGGGGSMAIGGSITSATAGSVLFAGTSGVLQQDNTNFFWDNSNKRLGIGTATPANDLTISKVQNSDAILTISNTNTGNNAGALLNAISNAGFAQFGKWSNAHIQAGFIIASDSFFYNATSGDISIWNNVATGKIKFGAGTITAAQMTLTAAGRLLIGTTTESTFILDVNGTTRLNGSTTFGTLGSGTGMFWDNTNNRLGIGTATPSYTFDIPANNTSLIQHRVGTFQVQSYALNNGFMSDNMYYNGTTWTRTTTGFGYGFQFYNGQVMFHGAASGTGAFTQNVKFKFDQEGAFVIGNNLATAQGTYTGATALFTKNGRLLLGTTTEGTDILKVNGTSLFQDNTLISKDQNAVTGLSITNTTSGTTAGAAITLTSDTAAGNAVIGKRSTARTAYKILSGQDLQIYSTIGGDIAILNDFASGTIKFAAGSSSTAQVTIGTTGLTTFATGVDYKRLNPTTTTVASTATLTPDISVGDLFTITAQAVALSVANPTGTPINGQKMIIRIEDNGTARAITWSGTQYRASSDLALPTTTIATKTMYLGFIYNSTDTKWDLIAFLNNF